MSYYRCINYTLLEYIAHALHLVEQGLERIQFLSGEICRKSAVFLKCIAFAYYKYDSIY